MPGKRVSCTLYVMESSSWNIVDEFMSSDDYEALFLQSFLYLLTTLRIHSIGWLFFFSAKCRRGIAIRDKSVASFLEQHCFHWLENSLVHQLSLTLINRLTGSKAEFSRYLHVEELINPRWIFINHTPINFIISLIYGPAHHEIKFTEEDYWNLRYSHIQQSTECNRKKPIRKKINQEESEASLLTFFLASQILFVSLLCLFVQHDNFIFHCSC